MEHKTDWKLKEIVTPDDMNRIEGNIKELESPTFDDSGTTEGINSFTDFMEKVKSKMNVFDFLKNFKTGLKYIVHTGQIINTQDVTQEGFALDARQANPNIPGSLAAQISDVNKNIAYGLTRDANIDSIITTTRKRMFNATGTVPFGTEGDNDFFLDVIMDGNDQSIVLQVARNVRGDNTKIRRYFNSVWQNWNSYITNSDLIANQYPATLLNGWTQPFGDNQLIIYKIGNLYMLSGIIRSPSIITEDTYSVANLNLPFNFTGQGCVNISVNGEYHLYLTSYNDNILHDQYHQVVPDIDYMIKGFFIH